MQSDGNISPIDSLYSCSESGVSANISTILKRVPLVPIDPPLEFQDSPRPSFVKQVPKNFLSAFRKWTSSPLSIQDPKDNIGELTELNKVSIQPTWKRCDSVHDLKPIQYECSSLKKGYSTHNLYSSACIWQNLADHMHDEPNKVACNLLDCGSEAIETKEMSSPPRSILDRKMKPNMCQSYHEQSRFLTEIRFDPDGLSTGNRKSTCFSYIHKSNGNCPSKGDIDNWINKKIHKKAPYPSVNSSLYYNNSGIVSGNRHSHNRSSLKSRLSSSHNSLSLSTANKADDSIFITEAMSHDTLLTSEISDFYNVPLDSDIYALPIDMIHSKICFYSVESDVLLNRPIQNYSKPHRKVLRNKRKKKFESDEIDTDAIFFYNPTKECREPVVNSNNGCSRSREAVNLTVDEIQHLYQSIYSNSSKISNVKTSYIHSEEFNTSNKNTWEISSFSSIACNIGKADTEPNSKADKLKLNTYSKHCELRQQAKSSQEQKINEISTSSSSTLKQNIIWDRKFLMNLNLKKKFCSIFRFRQNCSRFRERDPPDIEQNLLESINECRGKFQTRELPPVPKKGNIQPGGELMGPTKNSFNQAVQFTTSIEKVKDYGWYWGPLSCEAAEKVLSNEPDGSFIVRDSSDDHYIFSLSFKLKNCVRHVRIEQDQGTFSFGSYAKFQSQAITEFIEKAVEHSRSGRYLFFLHRRPEHGPMRVQLTNPVSRFKHIQSLQHMCRFVILKAVVRKDLLLTLPLPRRLLAYLSYKQCFSEKIGSDNAQLHLI